MQRLLWMLLVVLGWWSSAWSSEDRLGAPMPGPLVPASSFGEYRSGHYHGGLDFSTGGREGVPVLAPRSGWVYRVRASGIGYGRSVYFRLDDGRTVVYGHLSRFESRLEAFVDAAQDRQGAYEVDLYPEPNTLAYAIGDTLAFSGQSGAGPPHLHAEVRTGKEAAVSVNPWHAGWAPADSVPPRIGGVRIEPGEPGVLINGGLDPVVMTTGKATSTVRITGRVRMWIQCWDPVPTGAHMAPYRVTARIGEDVGKEIVFDAIDWNWAREVSWTFLAPLARKGDDAWIALDPAPGGRQHLARPEKDWEEDLEPGPHTLTVVAEDGAGNTSRVLLTLIKETPSSTVSAGVVRKASLQSRGGYLEIKLPGTSPNLRLEDERGKDDEPDMTRLSARGGTVLQIGRPDHPGLWSVMNRDSLLARAVWLSGSEGSFPWKRDDDSVVVSMTEGSLGARRTASYGPLWVVLRAGTKPAATAGELEPVTGVIEMQPWATPLRDDATIRFALSGVRDRRGLAVLRRDGQEWSFVGADTTGKGIRGSVGSLETVAVFRDRTPPRIKILPVIGGRRPRLRAVIRENGVGLAISRLRFMLDGKTVVSEWDLDAETLIGHLRGPVLPGAHELYAEAVDRVGNVARTRLTFTVR